MSYFIQEEMRFNFKVVTFIMEMEEKMPFKILIYIVQFSFVSQINPEYQFSLEVLKIRVILKTIVTIKVLSENQSPQKRQTKSIHSLNLKLLAPNNARKQIKFIDFFYYF